MINTGLDGFILPGEEIEIGSTTIRSVQAFDKVPDVIGLEALAQLGALHVRHTIDLSRHVFLMKIRQSTLPASPRISGRFRLIGVQESHTDRTWMYRVRAEPEAAGESFGGTFLFGTRAYDAHFNKDLLQSHYRKVFSCLNSA